MSLITGAVLSETNDHSSLAFPLPAGSSTAPGSSRTVTGPSEIETRVAVWWVAFIESITGVKELSNSTWELSKERRGSVQTKVICGSPLLCPSGRPSRVADGGVPSDMNDMSAVLALGLSEPSCTTPAGT